MSIKSVRMRDGQFLTVQVLGEDKTKVKQHVMLVHGIGGSHKSWTPFALPFLKDFTFVIPNLRGFGESQNVNYNSKDVLTNFSQDLEDTIEALVPQGEKVILVGLSMGAYTCMRFLEMTNCRRVEKYLNVDQSPKALNTNGWELGMLSHRQKYILPRMMVLLNEGMDYVNMDFEKLPEEFRSEYFDSMGDFFECAFHRPVERALAKNLIKFGIPPIPSVVCAHKFSSYFACLRAYVDYDYDFRESMSKHNIPISVFIGKYSVMYPADGQRYVANNAKNPKHVVEFEESHALMYTAPLKFLEAFKKFLYDVNEEN